MRLFGELTKIEEQPDGTLKVYGVASTGARDDVGEIVLPAAMKAALPDYARYPALREMHQPTAAGRTLEATVDDDGVTRIVAQVVDPVAIAKVKSRTYSGFSIGGKVLARDPADATVITKIRLSEISLVDRPANPEAVIDLWKAAAPPSNETVKALAGDLARAAGRPGAWKDYVAKARAALMDDPPDPSADEADEAPDLAAEAPPSDDGDQADESDSADGAGADDAVADDGEDADGTDAAARLAEIASEDPTILQAAHDALMRLGAQCDPSNCPEMQKRWFDDDDVDQAMPRMETLERRLAEQDALIQRLAATPTPPRTAANGRAIGKSEDADPAAGRSELSPDDLEKVFAALTPDERAFLLMKASLRQPIPLT